MTAASKAGRPPIVSRREVVRLVRLAGSVGPVAKLYGISRHTIHRHIRNHERLTGEWVERRGPGRPSINAGANP